MAVILRNVTAPHKIHMVFPTTRLQLADARRVREYVGAVEQRHPVYRHLPVDQACQDRLRMPFMFKHQVGDSCYVPSGFASARTVQPSELGQWRLTALRAEDVCIRVLDGAPVVDEQPAVAVPASAEMDELLPDFDFERVLSMAPELERVHRLHHVWTDDDLEQSGVIRYMNQYFCVTDTAGTTEYFALRRQVRCCVQCDGGIVL